MCQWTPARMRGFGAVTSGGRSVISSGLNAGRPAVRHKRDSVSRSAVRMTNCSDAQGFKRLNAIERENQMVVPRFVTAGGSRRVRTIGAHDRWVTIGASRRVRTSGWSRPVLTSGLFAISRGLACLCVNPLL